MNTQDKTQYLDNFASHYKYDVKYLRILLETSEAGFDKFNALGPLSDHREHLSEEAFWVAKLAAMMVEDCGQCLQLNIRMALEAGVKKALLQAIVNQEGSLPKPLQGVFEFASSIATRSPLTDKCQQELDAQLSVAEKAEIGLCVASARAYPTLKRALGLTESCNIISYELS